jgi:hypothetical protein
LRCGPVLDGQRVAGCLLKLDGEGRDRGFHCPSAHDGEFRRQEPGRGAKRYRCGRDSRETADRGSKPSNTA